MVSVDVLLCDLFGFEQVFRDNLSPLANEA